MPTIPTSVRLPAEVVARLDRFATASDRPRSYWIERAVMEFLEREEPELLAVLEAIEEDEVDPDGGLTSQEMDQWMIERGLVTREALERAESDYAGREQAAAKRRA
jgi:predicted transcriptional regulator